MQRSEEYKSSVLKSMFFGSASELQKVFSTKFIKYHKFAILSSKQIFRTVWFKPDITKVVIVSLKGITQL